MCSQRECSPQNSSILLLAAPSFPLIISLYPISSSETPLPSTPIGVSCHVFLCTCTSIDAIITHTPDSCRTRTHSRVPTAQKTYYGSSNKHCVSIEAAKHVLHLHLYHCTHRPGVHVMCPWNPSAPSLLFHFFSLSNTRLLHPSFA